MIYFCLFIFFAAAYAAAVLLLPSICEAFIDYDGTPRITVNLNMPAVRLKIAYHQINQEKVVKIYFASWLIASFVPIKKESKNQQGSAEKQPLYKRLLRFKRQVSENKHWIKQFAEASDIQRFTVQCELSWKQPAVTGLIYGLYHAVSPYVPAAIDLKVIPVTGDENTKCGIFLKFRFYFIKFLNILYFIWKEKKRDIRKQTLHERRGE